MISVRDALTLAVGLAPNSFLKRRLLQIFQPKWTIAHTAHVGPTVLLHVDALHMGHCSRLGSFNVLRDLASATLDSEARIGQWNWISSARPLRHLRSRAGCLHLKRGAALTSRHYVDCSGGVQIGEMATVAGVRSSLVTHGIDIADSVQRCAPIEIGDYSLVGSNCKIVPGANVPAKSLVAMGSVVARGLSEPLHLYAGTPARAMRPLEEIGYFVRTESFVHPDRESLEDAT